MRKHENNKVHVLAKGSSLLFWSPTAPSALHILVTKKPTFTATTSFFCIRLRQVSEATHGNPIKQNKQTVKLHVRRDVIVVFFSYPHVLAQS